jgi:hypothetical protein
MPTGRGILGTFHDMKILNVCAPSGTTRRREREEFFNTDIPRLLLRPHDTLIISGDFNCVVNPTDTTGTLHFSRALPKLLTGLELRGTWNRGNNQPLYTHYTPTGAARLDRIYISKNLIQAKKSTIIYATVFTDHLAVVLHIDRSSTFVPRGRVYWKLNPTILQDKDIAAHFTCEWEAWKRTRDRYPKTVHWWVRHVNPKIGNFFRKCGAELRLHHKHTEDFVTRRYTTYCVLTAMSEIK